MTAEHGVFLASLLLASLWVLWLLVSAYRDVKRRPWWREPKRGDLVQIGRRKWR